MTPMYEHPVKGKGYMTFTPDHSEKHAVESFAKRFGRKPDVVFRHNNEQLWIGPEEVDDE